MNNIYTFSLIVLFILACLYLYTTIKYKLSTCASSSGNKINVVYLNGSKHMHEVETAEDCLCLIAFSCFRFCVINNLNTDKITKDIYIDYTHTLKFAIQNSLVCVKLLDRNIILGEFLYDADSLKLITASDYLSNYTDLTLFDPYFNYFVKQGLLEK